MPNDQSMSLSDDHLSCNKFHQAQDVLRLGKSPSASQKSTVELKPWSLGIGHWSLDIIEIIDGLRCIFLILNSQSMSLS